MHPTNIYPKLTLSVALFKVLFLCGLLANNSKITIYNVSDVIRAGYRSIGETYILEEHQGRLHKGVTFYLVLQE